MTALPLNGRVALVTGAGKRTGRTIALALAQAGANLAIHYHHSGNEAEAVVDEIKALGRKAQAFEADLSDATATEAAFSQATESMGRLDL